MPSDLDDLIEELTKAVNGISDLKQRKAVVNAINELKAYFLKLYPKSGWIPYRKKR